MHSLPSPDHRGVGTASTFPGPALSRPSLEPFLDVLFEIVEVSAVLKVFVYQIPVNADIVMNQYVSKPSDRRYLFGKLQRENLEMTQDEKDFIVVVWFLRIFNGDDPVPHVDQTLDRHLEVSFDDVAEIGLLVELFSALLS